MDFKALATTILENVGGKENVSGVVHCATRLRFTLKDDSKVNTDVIKKTKGVLSVVNAGGQYQVVIGPDVPQVYQEVLGLGGFEASKPVEADDKEDNRSRISKILEGIASIFQPIIPAITGAGLIKAIMALCGVCGILQSGTQTHTILNAMADSAFYFIPILLAASCARKFKCNQGTAMALAGLLVYPAFLDLMTNPEVEQVIFLGILPVTKAKYASSVIPIILGVWFMSYVEHFMQKVSPKAIKFFSVPFVSLLAGGTATIVALGPIGAWVAGLINIFFVGLNNTAPWLVPTIVGIFNPLLVMTGTHYGLIPIGTNNLATVKWDTVVGPGMLVSNVAQGAAGLAVGLRSKNEDTKQQATSAGLTGVLGITEPVLYGVNLKFTFPLYAAMIGGGVGGLFLGITRVARFAAGSPGLLVLPVYIPTPEVTPLGYTMNNFVFAIVGVIIAMVVAFIASYIMFDIWAKKGKLDPEETGMKAALPETAAAKHADNEIVAVVNGELIPASQIKDEAFATELMGQTVAVEPTDGLVASPANGTIEMIFDTGHAFAVRMKDGTGILIHIGIDTVSMKGQGFKVLKKQGDLVKAGEPVIRADLAEIKKAGYSAQTMIVITEAVDDKKLEFTNFGKVTCGQTIAKS